MIILYDYELSGNCYKIRLFMSMLQLNWETIDVDFYPGLEHKSEAFLRINPLGQIPVVSDNGRIVRDSNAILVYLARQYDSTGLWFPESATAMASQMEWFGFAESINQTVAAARLHDAMFFPVNIEVCREKAIHLFEFLEEHLWFAEQSGRKWLSSREAPTLADVACFPYVALSEEGGISREMFPAIRRWLDRVKSIDGFIVMPGIFPLSPYQARALAA